MMIGVPTNKLAQVQVTFQNQLMVGRELYHTKGINQVVFLGYDFTVNQTVQEQKIFYSVNDHTFGFLVPAVGEATRWAYWCCNGYQSLDHMRALGGIQPMWRHLLNAGNLHMMFGGGDQLYMDGIVKHTSTSGLSHEGLFALPLLQAWLKLPHKERLVAPFPVEMANQIYEFALQQYIDQFTEEEFQTALATIPSIMTWDDHDCWDGMGSYTEYNNSNVSSSPLYGL
jgi:hypothetical protein